VKCVLEPDFLNSKAKEMELVNRTVTKILEASPQNTVLDHNTEQFTAISTALLR
jgi:hypothetical protein